MRFKPFALAVLLLLTTPGLTVLSLAQNSGQSPNQIPRLSPNPGLAPDDRIDEERAKLEKDMAKKANRERQLSCSATLTTCSN